MYVSGNPKSKAEVKRRLAAGERLTVFSVSPFEARAGGDGTVALEGPHYPEPHRWYGVGTVRGGYLVAIK